MATTNSHDDAHNNANDTIEIDLPSHLRCHSTPLSGRTITTRIKINKGSTAFTEVPFAHSIHFAARQSTCDTCFAQCDVNTLEYECEEGCGIHYCSKLCKQKRLSSAHAHMSSYTTN